jgi:hypothetical protein
VLGAADECAFHGCPCPDRVFKWQNALFWYFHFIAIGIRTCFEAAISHHINGWGIFQRYRALFNIDPSFHADGA